MSLQPSNSSRVDRNTTAPFLLRLYWRQSRTLDPYEFAVAPPADTSTVPDYSSLLPSSIRQQSVQIYTWSTCTLSELTGLLSTVLPESVLLSGGSGKAGSLAVGTRLVYKLIFPDTRGGVSESGRGKWVDRPLGHVVVGNAAAINGDDEEMNGGDMKEGGSASFMGGDADKTLADARFVIGDYVACTIYPPGPDGRVAPPPSIGGGRGPRDPYAAPRDPPPRENGFGGRGGGSYRGGGRGGFGGAPPPGDIEWRRGDRPGGGGYGGGYRGRGGGRPY